MSRLDPSGRWRRSVSFLTACSLAFTMPVSVAQSHDAGAHVHDHSHAHGDADVDAAGILSVQIPYESHDDIQRLSQWIDHMRHDDANRRVTAEIGRGMLEALREAGFTVLIDEKETARIEAFIKERQLLMQKQKERAASGPLQASRAQGDPLFNGNASCYRTVDQTNVDIDDLAKRYPDLVRVVPLGKTWVQTQLLSFRNLLVKYLPQSVVQLIDLEVLPAPGGEGMRVVVLGNQAVIKDKVVPRMVTTSSIHAREYTPAEISTRFTEWLVEGYGTNPTATWLLNNNEFHFILHANPDGRRMAEQAVPQAGGVGWRKNVNLVDALCTGTNGQPTSSRQPVNSGVDLNRNFPFGWNSTAGQGSSGDACSAIYRGKSAASEPETKAIVKYIAGERQEDGQFAGGVLRDRRVAENGDFVTGAPNDYEGLFFDIHSYSQLVLWPWGIRRESLNNTSATSNDEGMSALGQRLAWYNGYRATQMIDYNTDGTTTDTMYGELGAPSFTIELGTSFYEPCDAFEKDTFPKNVASLRYAARTLKAPYLLPIGPDAADIALSAQTVKQGETVTVTATIDDDRYLYDRGYLANVPTRRNEPSPVTAANAYINLLPWDSGAQPITLKPVGDAAFGSGPTLQVKGEIDTSRLLPGKHLIYVQGVNERGRAGPPDAVFLEVLAPDPVDPCPTKGKAA